MSGGCWWDMRRDGQEFATRTVMLAAGTNLEVSSTDESLQFRLEKTTQMIPNERTESIEC